MHFLLRTWKYLENIQISNFVIGKSLRKLLPFTYTLYSNKNRVLNGTQIKSYRLWQRKKKNCLKENWKALEQVNKKEFYCFQNKLAGAMSS